jgi:hypothetical protein
MPHFESSNQSKFKLVFSNKHWITKKHVVVKVTRHETPLMSSIRCWFRLSFCTPFSALHSSIRNHATRFSMFFSSSKRVANILCCFSSQCTWPLFFDYRCKNWTYDLACRKYSVNHWHFDMPFRLRNVLSGCRLHIKITLVGN